MAVEVPVAEVEVAVAATLAAVASDVLCAMGRDGRRAAGRSITCSATNAGVAADASLVIDEREVARGVGADVAPAAAMRQPEPLHVGAEAAVRGGKQRSVGGVCEAFTPRAT